MASVKVILREKKVLKNGEHPIALRIIKDRKIKYIHLAHSSSVEHWDEEANRPNKKHPNKNLRNYLDKQQTKAEDLIIDLEREDRGYSLGDLEKKFRNSIGKISVFDCFDEKIASLLNSNKIGNWMVYKDVKSSLENFAPNRDIRFVDINYDFLLRYEEYLLSRGNTANGIGVRMRTLRAIYNYAINKGYIKSDQYPYRNNFNRKGFSVTKFEKEPSRKALSLEEMEKVRNLKLDYSSPLFDSWNIFLFSYYLMGMNFTDMAYLKWENIVEDKVSYQRAKTGKRYVIRLLEPAQKIIKHYRKLKSKSDYVFPILNKTHDTPTSQKYRIQKMLKMLNADLKKIGKEAKISIPLTSYVARHTWANVLKRKDIPISKISEGLGHRTEKTTRIYLESFENDEIDMINELLVLKTEKKKVSHQ